MTPEPEAKTKVEEYMEDWVFDENEPQAQYIESPVAEQEVKTKKWKTIRANGITVASGYECPECGLISPSLAACSCRKSPVTEPEAKTKCSLCNDTEQIGEEEFYLGRSVGWRACPKCTAGGMFSDLDEKMCKSWKLRWYYRWAKLRLDISEWYWKYCKSPTEQEAKTKK